MRNQEVSIQLLGVKDLKKVKKFVNMLNTGEILQGLKSLESICVYYLSTSLDPWSSINNRSVCLF
jgi:hypothetical protein